MNWQMKPFDELETRELYAILKARAEVFVVEQNCPYLDPDGLDLLSYHIFASDEKGDIAAYCRITPPGTRFPEVSIGRVITTAAYRQFGLGKIVMQKAVDFIYAQYGQATPITISAQSYLKRFYGLYGFKPIGEEYLEDGLPHTQMRTQG